MESLRKTDEVTLLELLELTSDDLVDAFLDKIRENKDRLYKYVSEQSDAQGYDE